VRIKALVRGVGDVGSAVAHRFHQEGVKTVLHDVPFPAWTRRKMAFTDAVFDGEAELAGVRAERVDDLSVLEDRLASNCVAVWVHDLLEITHAFRPDILVDARMRKRHNPEPQMDAARLTIGLGPNFIAKETTHVVIETAWGNTLGTVITDGTAEPQQGGPRMIGGLGIERIVYSPEEGLFTSGFAIGDCVTAGQVVAHVGQAAISAPVDGWIRGLTRSGVPVARRTKVIEIDPRGLDAVFTGIGERPAKIADGVIRAVRAWASPSARTE
jgi:xanthine dehydrogenase accessory factor